MDILLGSSWLLDMEEEKKENENVPDSATVAILLGEDQNQKDFIAPISKQEETHSNESRLIINEDSVSIGEDDDDEKMSTGTSILARVCGGSEKKNEEEEEEKMVKCNGHPQKKTRHQKPLIEFLCEHYHCSIQELQIHFMNVEMRKRILKQLREKQVKTTHLRPRSHNLRIRCDDFSCQNANFVPAFNGYLGITVRQYYYIKHGLRLRYPFMPCLIEHGGGTHRSFYPLEVLSVSTE